MKLIIGGGRVPGRAAGRSPFVLCWEAVGPRNVGVAGHGTNPGEHSLLFCGSLLLCGDNNVVVLGVSQEAFTPKPGASVCFVFQAMVVFRRVRRKRRETLDERVQRVIDKHFQEFTPFQIEELVIELGKPLRETLKWALVNVWFPCVLSGSHDHYFKELRQKNEKTFDNRVSFTMFTRAFRQSTSRIATPCLPCH